MMVAEMSLADEKKTQEGEIYGASKVADAEALALAALKAAEEAKRAAERLKDLRACLAYLQDEKSVPSKNLEEKPAIKEEPPVVEERDETAKELVVETKPEETKALEPEASAATSAPTSILKSEAPADKDETQKKEVRLSPDTIVETEENSPKELPVADKDLLESLLDAVGVDKACGLEFEEEAAIPNHNARYAVLAGSDPFGGSLPIRTAAARAAARSNQATPTRAPVATPEPATPTVEPVESPLVAESEAAVPVAAEAAVAAETPVEATTTDPAEKTTAAPEEEDSIVEKKGPKMTHLSPIKQELLRRRHQAPVLQKPDPFSGEMDGTDFMLCGAII